MDWTAAVDGYCERLAPGFWAEPINAVTNLAFLLAAGIIARRLRGTGLPVAWALTALLALIGIGSFLFHTFAQPWAALADVLPIALFALLYTYAASRAFLGLSWPVSALITAGVVPGAAVMSALLAGVPVYGPSGPYLILPVLIAAYALILRRSAPTTARNLGIGAAILLVSLTFRGLDAPLCAAFPVGTHFAWHLLNAVMLAWMIETYRAHMLAPLAPRR
ncbi:ceramidase domain-containing protein [Roseovarius aestuariivivens]|uniref:ceramidase domain-containing protein n=1 Tax=Roseovarius aestuariivivens TaxID=1888910 RepID=UPI001080A097|nr:ceramidase domain-containing protein [Roseovarius aestuariivivens]